MLVYNKNKRVLWKKKKKSLIPTLTIKRNIFKIKKGMLTYNIQKD